MQEQDKKIEEYREVLKDSKVPKGRTGQGFQHFMQVSKFSILNEQLRKGDELAVNERKRLEFIPQVHNDQGNKESRTVKEKLKKRFWCLWDIKLPRAKGYGYIIDRRSLPCYPKHDKPRVASFKSITKLIHNTLLCQQNVIKTIISDDAPQIFIF